jgi:medium-chain acyl-[acyl-carrier-protein] hydrolase
MNKIWSETYNVHTYELDRRQKVSVRAICSYLIDAAGLHVHELGYSIPQLLEKQRSWFFSRFLLRMEEYPGWRDRITVETWPPGSQKLLALRDWRLFSGQRLIGEATSGWLMIDIARRRPLRPESYAEWRTFIHPERTIPHVFGRLPGPGREGEPSESWDFRVRFSDVDLNGHANYLSYIDWILESLPPAVREQRRMTEMEVHFLREASFAEELAGVCRPASPPQESKVEEFLHAISRRGDGQELVRARTVWKEP